MTDQRQAEVVFYWRPGCPFCFALRRQLRRERLPFREVNIWTDADAAARVRGITGGDETVPTVVVGPASMVNPRPAEVVAAVRRHAPALLEERAAAKETTSGSGPRGWLRRLWPRRSGA